MMIPSSVADQLVAAGAGLILLAAVMLLWRRSLAGSTVLLALSGWALAGLVFVVALAHGSLEGIVVAVVVGAVKGFAIPTLVRRTSARVGAAEEGAPLVNPTVGMLLAAVLCTVAYFLTRPLIGADASVAARSMPVGIAVVLIGFLLLATRRQAPAQIVGFVTVDNGIALTAFLFTGGLPLVVELGVLFDVVLVVLVLALLVGRIHRTFGSTDMNDLRELHD